MSRKFYEYTAPTTYPTHTLMFEPCCSTLHSSLFNIYGSCTAKL